MVGAWCRQGMVEEAVVFAQASLSPMRGLLTHRNRAYDAMLHDVIALLAYEDPLVSHHGPPTSLPSLGTAPFGLGPVRISVLFFKDLDVAQGHSCV